MNKFFMCDIHYLLMPLIGGVGVAILCGPLGALMVWRRLAYFGDTLAHSGLLGITLALALKINVLIGVCVVALLVAWLLLRLQNRLHVASDTLLGLLSHTALALGLLLLAMLHDIRVDVLGFLYGDILAISQQDILIIYLGGALVLGLLAFLWSTLLRITVDKDLAQVEGVMVAKVEACYVFLLAFVVAMAIKMVGVLLISALLIIPAASARAFATSPERMALIASLMGAASVIFGIIASHIWDVPTGPAIVVSASIMMIGSILISLKK